jgi:hypothetical protein
MGIMMQAPCFLLFSPGQADQQHDIANLAQCVGCVLASASAASDRAVLIVANFVDTFSESG